MSSGTQPESGAAERWRRRIVIVIVVLMTIDLTGLLINQQWLSAFLVISILGLILSPLVLRKHLPVSIPAELQILALLFVFAALFLGEIRDYYENIWWWDIALHTSSGLLLGILGFLLIYILNESRSIDMHMRPRFIALFAFLFAVAVGAVWEIFEYSMDSFFGTTMQKPMLGDPSGLTDTMWDLIVDTLGALTISLFGWWYMHRGERWFMRVWIEKFIAQNPGIFSR